MAIKSVLTVSQLNTKRLIEEFIYTANLKIIWKFVYLFFTFDIEHLFSMVIEFKVKKLYFLN